MNEKTVKKHREQYEISKIFETMRIETQEQRDLILKQGQPIQIINKYNSDFEFSSLKQRYSNGKPIKFFPYS